MFKVDDEVRILRGRLAGKYGIVLAVEGRHLTVQTAAGKVIIAVHDVEAA